ncbi:helicase associated domain-containing protein [Streptomyces sp. NPDC059575]|uniref:helicase associated domain-containing protein n=1 Tax=Streptomyces sp. NPDC059575 TaxID=3346872 RepID=UPI0036CF341B
MTPNSHSFPLGRWLADQRRAFQARTLAAQRAADLEELGMDWTPADTGWEENLAAARAYYATAGTLATPVTALDRPVGQWLANCRKGIALGKDPARAERRAAQLAEIDPDWRPAWPVDWQRSYAGVEQMVALEDVVPAGRPRAWTWGGGWGGSGSTLSGSSSRPGSVSAWRPLGSRPCLRWRRRCGRGRPGRGPRGCLRRSCGGVRLEQYRARTGSVEAVSRSHVETPEDQTEVRLGVWLSNVKSRRAGLSREQLERLSGLGLEWAQDSLA